MRREGSAQGVSGIGDKDRLRLSGGGEEDIMIVQGVVATQCQQ